jgi:type I restriction enzyme S subunit
MTQIVLLGDEIEFAYGKGLPRRDRIGGEFPVFGSNGQVDTHNKSIVNGPGIIVGRKGSVGEVIWSDKGFWPIDTTYYVKPKNQDDSLRYWYYQLKTLGLNKLNTHSAIPGLNRDVAYAKNIIKREPEDQKKIADILSTLDEKIELNRKMNETLEQMGQALFKHYFITNPAAKEWEKKPLDEVAEFLNGLAMQKYPKVDGEPTLPVIKIREMSSGITPNTDIASAEIPEKYVVRNGDLLFSWSGTLLVKFWSEGDGALNQHLFKVTSSEYPEWFYYYWIKHHLEDFKRTAKSKATTMGHIQRRHLTQAKVLVPDAGDMQKIGEQIQPLIDIAKANSKQIQTLTALRDTLLPRLISGKAKV